MGTFSYASSPMKKLVSSKNIGFVNLYDNDKFGL